MKTYTDPLQAASALRFARLRIAKSAAILPLSVTLPSPTLSDEKSIRLAISGPIMPAAGRTRAVMVPETAKSDRTTFSRVERDSGGYRPDITMMKTAATATIPAIPSSSSMYRLGCLMSITKALRGDDQCVCDRRSNPRPSLLNALFDIIERLRWYWIFLFTFFYQ